MSENCADDAAALYTDPWYINASAAFLGSVNVTSSGQLQFTGADTFESFCLGSNGAWCPTVFIQAQNKHANLKATGTTGYCYPLSCCMDQLCYSAQGTQLIANQVQAGLTAHCQHGSAAACAYPAQNTTIGSASDCSARDVFGWWIFIALAIVLIGVCAAAGNAILRRSRRLRRGSADSRLEIQLLQDDTEAGTWPGESEAGWRPSNARTRATLQRARVPVGEFLVRISQPWGEDFKSRYADAIQYSNGECAICFDPLASRSEHADATAGPDEPTHVVSLPACRHIFHTACILRWVQRQTTCPVCRAVIVDPDRDP